MKNFLQKCRQLRINTEMSWNKLAEYTKFAQGHNTTVWPQYSIFEAYNDKITYLLKKFSFLANSSFEGYKNLKSLKN